MSQSIYKFYKLSWSSLDFLFPPICGGCNEKGSRWCDDCQNQVQIFPESICRQCGRPFRNAKLCSKCRSSPPPYTELRSWAVYKSRLRNAIHRLKYFRDMALGEILSRPLISLFNDLNWKIDMITPVPLGIARLSQRGYNQAALLAKPFALGTNINYQPKALNKIRETVSQVGLSYSERRTNVVDAFKANTNTVLNKNILVVDDVTSSGATMEACSKALKIAGANKVYGITLAGSLQNNDYPMN